MAAPDPRSKFGNVQAGGAPVARPTQLVAADSVQSATLPALAMAKLGDTLQQTMEVVRKSGIENDRLKTDAMLSELGNEEAKIRSEQTRIQQDKGEMWTPEQLQTDYNTRLEEAKGRLRTQYKVDWIQEEQEASLQKWTNTANESYLRGVVQPRIADIGRRNIEQQSINHQQRAATLAGQGDILGSLQALGDAAAAYDSPQGAVLFTPEALSIRKNKIWTDGAVKNLAIQDPKRVIELTESSLALRGAAEKNPEDQAAKVALANDPLRGFTTAKLLDMKNDMGVIAKQQDREKQTEIRQKEADQANGIQNNLRLLISNPQTSTRELQSALVEFRSKAKDLIENNPGSPLTDVYGAGAVSLQNEIEGRVRKAEARANKSSGEVSERGKQIAFLSSDDKINPEDSSSYKFGNGLYADLAKQNGYDKMPPEKQVQFDLWAAQKLGFMPKAVETRWTQRALSDNPEVAGPATKVIASMARDNSVILKQLPSTFREAVKNVNIHGVPAEKAVKDAYKWEGLDDNTKAKINTSSDAAFDPKKGTHRAAKVLPSEWSGAVVPPSVYGTFQTTAEHSFRTNGQDADRASKDGASKVQNDYSLTTVTGRKEVAYRQPDKFGVSDASRDFQWQLDAPNVKQKVQVKNADGSVTTKEVPLTGKEQRQYIFKDMKDGKPVYNIRPLAKDGTPMVLLDSKGEMEFSLDSKVTPPAPVNKTSRFSQKDPVNPGAAEKFGKNKNRAALVHQMSTAGNPATQE